MEASGKEDASGSELFSALRLPPCECLPATGLLAAEPSRRPTFRNGGLTSAGKEAFAWRPVAGRTRQGQNFFCLATASMRMPPCHWPPCREAAAVQFTTLSWSSVAP